VENHCGSHSTKTHVEIRECVSIWESVTAEESAFCMLTGKKLVQNKDWLDRKQFIVMECETLRAVEETALKVVSITRKNKKTSNFIIIILLKLTVPHDNIAFVCLPP
jgi:hypothetical protein